MSGGAGQAQSLRGWSRVKRKTSLFLALSRTPHALLDLAAPAAAALLWLGRFPAAWVVALGLVTVFAGYTSVYALNDIVDTLADRRRLALGRRGYGGYLDARMVRHPIAQGALRMREAGAWAAAWGAAAVVGAFLFNPVCAAIFVSAFVLEGLYCLLARVTPLRTLISGVVKTAGPVAAIFAVDPVPHAGRLLLLFCWLYLWEIGGQNVPADWSDIDEDRKLGFRTLPVLVREAWASVIVAACLLSSVALSLFAARRFSWEGSALYWTAALAAGAALLLLPATRLLRTRGREDAMLLFNRASYYPLAMLAPAAIKAVFRI